MCRNRYSGPLFVVVVTVSGDIGTDVRAPTRITSSTLNEFVGLCCDRPHTDLLTDPQSLSLHQRVGRIGPLTTCEVVVDSDVGLDCGESCGAYRVGLVRSGHAIMRYRDSTIVSMPGDAAVYGPQGRLTIRWPPNSRIIAVKIDPCAVDADKRAAAARQRVQSTAGGLTACGQLGARSVVCSRPPLPRCCHRGPETDASPKYPRRSRHHRGRGPVAVDGDRARDAQPRQCAHSAARASAGTWGYLR